MLKRTLLALLAIVPLLALAGLATANSSVPQQLREVERATSQFRDVANAEAAGYAELLDAQQIACIDLPGVGGMGIHYVNGALVSDTVLDPRTPEAMVYAPARGDRLKLVAVEYIVFAGPWDAEHADPPSLFGVEFDLTPAGNRFGLDPFYALHAWIYRPNPAGVFTPWNPRVTCPA